MFWLVADSLKMDLLQIKQNVFNCKFCIKYIFLLSNENIGFVFFSKYSQKILIAL